MRSFLAFFPLLASGAWAVAAGGTEVGEFVRIWPENPAVEYGGSVVLNCSSNCGGIGLETSLNKISAGTGTTWKAFNLTGVTEWAPTPLCYAGCTTPIKPQRTNITVYQSQMHIVLEVEPKMEVGKDYNLTCRVSNVAPIRNLTVTLLKAGQKLLVKTFENHLDAKPGEVVVTHNITAQRADHGKEVICHAALDLRPEGPLIEKGSLTKSLLPFDLPRNPRLEAPSSIETNKTMDVTCTVSGVFPAEEARFDLSFAGKREVPTRNVSGGDTESVQSLVSPSSAGEHKLICTVSLGPVNRTAEKTVNVYSLPKPILAFDHPKILVNRSVIINCSSDGTASPGAEMEIRDKEQILTTGHPPFLLYETTTEEDDDGREFICQVRLLVAGSTMIKGTSEHLTVYYGPRMDNSSCPDTLTWKEGSEETFTCSAWGNPPPTVECKNGDTPYIIGVPQHVYRKHHGVYRCSATNTYGSDVRDVTIHVEPSQLNILAIILPTLLAVVGLGAAVTCYMLYRSHKIGEYRLKQKRQRQQAAGCPMEKTCLNGNAQTDNV